MIDREKTISCLNEIADYFRKCRLSASFGSKAEEHFWDLQIAAMNAAEMLKEMEPVEPKEIVNEYFPIGDYRRTIGWFCGKCGKTLMGDGIYCAYCGRKVKWNG